MPSLFTAEELTLDFPTIYGVSSSVRWLKLGFLLSQNQDIEVECVDDILTEHKGDKHAAYLLRYLDDGSESYVIKNKDKNSYFYHSYKSIDYLLCSVNEEEMNPRLIEIVKKIREISLCFELDMPNQKEILNFTQLL